MYRDLWRLDLNTWEWEELSVKGGPTARSGHRMLSHQNTIYMFGGYYDAGDTLPKYYRDLWAFDPSALKWTSLGDMNGRWPSARSGYQWVAHGDELVLHGGYSKQVDEDDNDMQHGVAMDDTWCWHIPTSKVPPDAAVGLHHHDGLVSCAWQYAAMIASLQLSSYPPFFVQPYGISTLWHGMCFAVGEKAKTGYGSLKASFFCNGEAKKSRVSLWWGS